MSTLLYLRCAAVVVGPMDGTEIESYLGQVSGWRLADGAIEKTYGFENFHQTMAFVNAVAWVCHVEDHHPELVLSYGRCVLRFNTHSVRGISINDFICAAKVDALLPAVG
jgi:4a-hydroxytetrahydrobiopterin dehydratase